MKKFYSFLFAAVALVGFTACNSDSTEDQPAPEQVGKMEFTANIGEDTKTQLGGTTEGKTAVLWCKNDVISVKGVTYSIKDKEEYNPAKSATFVGGNVTAPYYALYGTTSSTNNFEGLTLESELGVGNIADGSNIAVAYSEEEATLSFKNVLSILKFQVAAPCSTVTITSTAALEGEFEVEWNGGDPTVSPTSNDKEITLTVDGGFKTDKIYYTTILPGSHQFTVTIDDKPSKAASEPRDMTRNTIYNLGTLPIAAVFYVEGNADFNLYAWSGSTSIMGEWPGTAMTKIGSTNKYYAVIPDEYVGETFNYIVNWNGGQTKDLTVEEFASGYTYSISDPDPENITIYLNNNWFLTDLKIHSWDPTLWPGQTWDNKKAPDGTVTNDLGTFSYWNIDKGQIANDKIGNLLITGRNDKGNDKKTEDLLNVSYEKDVYLQFEYKDNKDQLEILTTPY